MSRARFLRAKLLLERGKACVVATAAAAESISSAGGEEDAFARKASAGSNTLSDETPLAFFASEVSGDPLHLPKN